MEAIFEYIPSQMRQLSEALAAADHDYYVCHRSPMPDSEYDEKMRRLQQLEEEYPMYADAQSPTHHVGSDLGSADGKVGEGCIRHLVPMLSVANVTTKADLLKWMERKLQETGGCARFMLEKKYDGIAVSLIYKRGLLQSASTRGDGHQGTDITENVMQIAGLPHMLPFGASVEAGGMEAVPEMLELRGEIILPDAAFERINAEAVSGGGNRYQTQRNAISAMTMTDTPEEYARRGAEVRIYQMIGEGLPDSNMSRQYLLEDWGVPGAIADMRYSDPQALLRAMEDHENLRRFCGFATDGMVIKVEQDSLRRNDRNTARYYDWAIAFKWAPAWRETRIIAVRFDVGRTGQINASALIEPVMIDGRCVTAVGLNSIKRLRELDLHYGDCIWVEMRGDCTPYLSGVNVEKRAQGAAKMKMPEHCPHCGTWLEQEGEKLFCRNEWCSGVTAKRMLDVARSAGVKGITEAMVEKLVGNGVYSASALLEYDERMLRDCGISRATARKVMKQTEKARKKGKVVALHSCNSSESKDITSAEVEKVSLIVEKNK